MSNSNTAQDLPIWPSGIVRLDGGLLEITTGDGIRVAVDDIVEIGVEPPRAGRFSLKLSHRAGLGRVSTSCWVEPEQAALERLVTDVATATGEA
jgi:hypothetical protein